MPTVNLFWTGYCASHGALQCLFCTLHATWLSFTLPWGGLGSLRWLNRLLGGISSTGNVNDLATGIKLTLFGKAGV